MQSTSSTKKQKRSLGQIVLLLLGLLYFALLGVVIFYLWSYTQDRYISVGTFKISRQNSSGSEGGLAALALPGLTDSGSADSQIATGFIDSADLLVGLEKEFNLLEHYSSPKRDFFFRLNKDAPLESRLDYYRKRIFAHYDKETGLTLLTVDSFDPKLSKELASTLLRRTEVFINSLNQTVADQQMVYVRTELERAEKHVREVSSQILDLQNSNGIIHPEEVISSNLLGIQALRTRLLQIETTLQTMERDSPGSPRIENLRSEIRSLNEQIAEETTKLSSPEQNSLNQVLARFKELDLQLEFALKVRAGAISLLEKHRMEAQSQSKFISIIQHPYLPESVGFPQRPYATITILVVGILLFFILRVLIHSIQEKA